MRASNYSAYEIDQRRDRIRQFNNDPIRQMFFKEMQRLREIGTVPYAIVNKDMTKVIEHGYNWFSKSLEIAYNRLVIALYEHENSYYKDLFA